jgi:hypothetical protein
MSELNLLFITTDQWRGDCLSAPGHATAQRMLSWRARHAACGMRHADKTLTHLAVTNPVYT